MTKIMSSLSNFIGSTCVLFNLIKLYLITANENILTIGVCAIVQGKTLPLFTNFY